MIERYVKDKRFDRKRNQFQTHTNFPNLIKLKSASPTHLTEPAFA